MMFARKTTSPGPLRHRLGIGLAGLLLWLCVASVGQGQMVDFNGDGLSDVWQAAFGAFGLDPNADADGDGVKNQQEARAGTDPFDPTAYPQVAGLVVSNGSVSLSVPAALGKRYQLQSTTNVNPALVTHWTLEASTVARTGAVVTLVAPANLNAKFFRLFISDVDTDGDGVNDWEEYQLGLDPFDAYSNGHLSAGGKLLNDYAYLTNPIFNQVSLRASGPTATEPASGQAASNTGTFTLTRSGLPLQAITVNLAVAGAGPGQATEGVDFSALPRAVTLPAGVRSQAITLVPLANHALQASVLATLTLQPPGGGTGSVSPAAVPPPASYTVGSPSNASVVIYPAAGSASGTVPVITSPLTALAFLNQPFAYTVVASNAPTRFSLSAVPPGLSFNPTNGLLQGTPTLLGDYPLTLTASNAVGLAASVLDLQVVDPNAAVSNLVSRELWTAVPGTNVADIPVDTPPNVISSLSKLEGPTGYGQNYGERVRAYLTPPVTGNYRFWIAGSDAVELWLSDDSEAVSKLRRAYVAPIPGTNSPSVNGTLPRQWLVQSNQKSPWLALQGGQKYYLEVLHKAGAGTNDNWAVGWLLDPNGSGVAPSGLVPSTALSPYFAPPLAVAPGTLYAANLLAQATVPSSAVGSATLRLSADQSQAILNFSYSGLSSAVTAEHIHSDPYLNSASQILFDIDKASPQSDGSYLWTLAPVGTLTVADILEILKEGKAYINVHTANFPAGEISGHFTLANGTQTFSAPPAPPAWTDDHTDPNAAARFLIQATYGSSSNDIAQVQSLGYEPWIDQQFGLPASHLLPSVLSNQIASLITPFPSDLARAAWWQQSITAPDQLRQRMAFALSEILVTSDRGGILLDAGDAGAAYYDLLLDHAFDNFREVLQAVTLSPAMGLYLDMLGNDKANAGLGTHPNENYARELMQLFSLGLNRLWPDGTLMLSSKGNLIPTYDQNVIMGLASALTGWNYAQANQVNGRLPLNWYPARDFIHPMVLVPLHHETAAKLVLDNVLLPGAQGGQADPANAAFDTFGAQDLGAALDSIFNHPNAGPFICRQLIQRLVTSNPSREYVYRVVQKFNDNGCGVRGDLQAVLRAILLDYEARSSALVGQSTFGKQREPVLRATAVARAFPLPATWPGTYSQNGSHVVTVTTAAPHGLATGDWTLLNFTDTSGQPAPPSQMYQVTTTGPKGFTINTAGLISGTYSQSNHVMTISAYGHGLLSSAGPGSSVYLQFISGGAQTGVYTVSTAPNGSFFTVATSDGATRTGNCVLPQFYATFALSNSGSTNILSVSTASHYPHTLRANDRLTVEFLNEGVSAKCTVTSVSDPEHFVATTTGLNVGGLAGILVYPLVAPPLVRSGTVAVQPNSYAMSETDSSLGQTPLHAPTVFNFFAPDFKFPGLLASAGMTTPEFQITTDITVVNQMNLFSEGFLSQISTTNNLGHLRGAISLDLSPWMTSNYTATASGLGNMVDGLNTLLLAGQLSAGAKSAIVNCVSDPVNFPYDSPPTIAEVRNRVCTALFLLVDSPDFVIQK